MITTLNIQCNQQGLCMLYASQWGSSEELERRSYTLSFRVLRVSKLQAYSSMGRYKRAHSSVLNKTEEEVLQVEE